MGDARPLKRILLVEDDADIQAIAQLAMESLGGFEVRTCASGREALDAAGEFKPDLILLDVMMPGMDGPTTLQALRSAPGANTVPVVFMTARSGPAETAQYRALGAAGIIAKPFDPLTLCEEINGIWAQLGHKT
jgi:two-component system OmpR family response regulator